MRLRAVAAGAVAAAFLVGITGRGTGAPTATAGEEFPKVTLKTFALSGEFKQPWQVAWVGNGTKTGAIVFTDRAGNQVGAVDPATGQTTRFALHAITGPNPVTVIDDTRYAVGGTGGVAIFDRTGTGSIRELQMANTQIANIALGPDGKLWLTNVVNGQVVAIKSPYSGPADITKLGPYAGCRPTGIVPGVNDVTVLCQQSNDLLVLDAAQGAEIRRIPLPDPAAGAQEAKRAPGGEIVFSGFSRDRLYAYRPSDARIRSAVTGGGPAVPLVTRLGASYSQVFGKSRDSYLVAVPHYRSGGITLAAFPSGTSRRVGILQGSNLVGTSHGPDCSLLVADATPGKAAIHKVQLALPKGKNRLQRCVTAVAPDFLARMAMPFFSIVPRPKAVDVSITGAPSVGAAGTTFSSNFRVSTTVTATSRNGRSYRPSVTQLDASAYSRLFRLGKLKTGTKSLTLTVSGRVVVPTSYVIDIRAVR